MGIKPLLFEALLESDGSVSIHHRNIQLLALEMFKVLKNETPEIMNEVFPINRSGTYNLRAQRDFYSRRIHTVHFGEDSIAFLAPKIWDIVPTEIKEAGSIAQFKKRIKKWIPIDCPCRLCKKYVPNLGYI